MSFDASGEQFEIRRGDLSAVLVEVGGGLRTLRLAGMDLLDGYGVEEMASAGRGQLLVPWPNRIRDGCYSFDGQDLQLALTEPAAGNAIHGLTRWTNWSAVERSDTAITMCHRLYPQPGYPFILDVSSEFRLSSAGLTVTMRATNVGSSRCPFGAGAHPYLRVGPSTVDSWRLRVPADRYLKTDERQIPVAEEDVSGSEFDFRQERPVGGSVLDVGYTGLTRDEKGYATIEIGSEDGRTRLRLWMDAKFRYAMVFTGDTVHPESRRRHGIAVEPMTCAPNAFNSGAGLLVLEPQESFEGAWGISPAVG